MRLSDWMGKLSPLIRLLDLIILYYTDYSSKRFFKNNESFRLIRKCEFFVFRKTYHLQKAVWFHFF